MSFDFANDTVTALEVALIDGLVIYLVVRYWISKIQKMWEPRKKEKKPWEFWKQ